MYVCNEFEQTSRIWNMLAHRAPYIVTFHFAPVSPQLIISTVLINTINADISIYVFVRTQ